MRRTEAAFLMIVTTLMHVVIQPFQIGSLRVSLTWGGRACEGHWMVPTASAVYKSCIQRWCHSDLASSIGWDATGLKRGGSFSEFLEWFLWFGNQRRELA